LLIIIKIAKAIFINNDKAYKKLYIEGLPNNIDTEYIDNEIIGLYKSLFKIRKGILNESLGFLILYLNYFSI